MPGRGPAGRGVPSAQLSESTCRDYREVWYDAGTPLRQLTGRGVPALAQSSGGHGPITHRDATMKKSFSLCVCCLAAAAASGCFGFERKTTLTGPTNSVGSALMGTWTSSNVIPSPASCTDFKWTATEQTANGARGAFSATCANDVRLAGTAQGTLNGSLVNWSAEGTASAAN